MKVSLGAANAVAAEAYNFVRRLKQPQLQLIYFPVRARAEAIQMVMAYGGVSCTLETVETYFGCNWDQVRARRDVPFGQLPLLVVNGQILAQSGAIVRYTAGLAGLTPTDPFLAAHCDSIFEAAQELTSVNDLINGYVDEAFEVRKNNFFATFYEKLANFAMLLADGPFFCGNRPAYCDFGVYHILDQARSLEPTCLDAAANINAFMLAVAQLPGVREYLDDRPGVVDIGTNPRLVAKDGSPS